MTATAHPVSIKIDEDSSPSPSLDRAAEARREAFRQETLKIWENYRATGLHVTAEAADAWLAEMEQGKDSGPPSMCHGTFP